MATNITSTALDFDTIRSSLKTYFAQQPEFSDYNFEASGLSNVLDVLAYSNGNRSIFKISSILNLNLESCLKILKKLKTNKLI